MLWRIKNVIDYDVIESRILALRCLHKAAHTRPETRGKVHFFRECTRIARIMITGSLVRVRRLKLFHCG